MPTYDYYCDRCFREEERCVPVAERNKQGCEHCDNPEPLKREVSAPLFRFKGAVTKGGGPDKFTADMLGIPLAELPSGLRTDVPPE